MSVQRWSLPIKAAGHRATTLRSLVFSADGLELQLVGESGLVWRLSFPEVQAFKCTTEESAASILGALPIDDAFFEVLESVWLVELGKGRVEYMATAKHFVVCCYDEVLEIVASGYSVTQE